MHAPERGPRREYRTGAPAFIADDETDWREAEELGVAEHHITQAKMVECKTLEERQTMSLVKRCDMADHGPYVYVKTRWVLVNKGSKQSPRVKARLVAKEFRTKTGGEELFSGTPGLSGIRLLLSDLATSNCGRAAMIADVTGAFLYGMMTRTVFIELPPELGGGGTQ